MRLTQEERTEITRTIAGRDPSATIYLFGSRVDDSARGGDLDLLVLSREIGLISLQTSTANWESRRLTSSYTPIFPNPSFTRQTPAKLQEVRLGPIAVSNPAPAFEMVFDPISAAISACSP